MTELKINTFIENDKIVKQAMLGQDEYWFKFPLSSADDLTDAADPFLDALIFPMMRKSGLC